MDTWAVVFTAPRQVEFRRVAVPAPRGDEVVVETTWSWISNGTEGSFLSGERADGETPASPERPAPFPIVPGYQRVGTVIQAGAEAGFAPGETVFATMTRVDGMAVGASGHVHRGPVHRDQIRRLPDYPAPEAYAGLVLTQVGYNCGTRPTLAAGDAVVVVGDGLVGHWSAQTARHRGARVLLLGRHAARLARFEGDVATDLTAVAEWAPEGVQAVIDTVGSVPTLEALFPRLRHDGHLVSAGFCGAAGTIDIQLLRRREATLHSPSGWTGLRLDATLAGIRDGWLTTLPLVTHRLPAERVAEAWERIEHERESTLGVLLDWREVV